MRKDKITILVLGFIGILVAGVAFYNPAEAAGASVYVSPASVSKNVGDVFDISIGVNPAGEKVCAVEGNLNLDKLSCQNIVIGEGIMAQSSPSCGNLYFLFGIPSCSDESKTLFTITVKANNVGAATADFTGIDIIGEGVSVSSDSSGGSYNLVKPETVLPPLPPSCDCTQWGSWQKRDCGGGDCVSTQLFQSRARACEPAGCDIEAESRCADDAFCASSLSSTIEEDAEVERAEEGEKEEVENTEDFLVETKPFLLATIGSVFSLGTGNVLVGIFVVLIIILLLFYGFYYLRQKRRKKTQKI